MIKLKASNVYALDPEGALIDLDTSLVESQSPVSSAPAAVSANTQSSVQTPSPIFNQGLPSSSPSPSSAQTPSNSAATTDSRQLNSSQPKISNFTAWVRRL